MDSKAVEKLTVDYLENIKEAQELKRQNELRMFDYSVRAQRREEIPLLHEQYRKEAREIEEEMMEAYQQEVARKSAEHQRNKQLKQLATVTKAHTALFLKRFTERREEDYQKAKRIQDQNKSEHERRQADRKRLQREKRERQMREIKMQQLKQMQSKQATVAASPPAAPPMTTSSPRARPVSPVAAPQKPPVRQPSLRNEPPPVRAPQPKLPPPRQEPLNLPPPRVERPPATGADSTQWRREPVQQPERRRPRFVNSRKKAEPAKAEPEAGAVPTKPPPVR